MRAQTTTATGRRPAGRWVVLAAALALGPLVALAADPWAASQLGASDALLQLEVKASLARDRDLVGLNLSVFVSNRAAVVGGPVPAANLIRRVEDAVRSVPGLSAARVDCWVAAADDRLGAMVGDRLRGGPAPAPSGPSLPHLVVGLVPPGAATPAEPGPAPVDVARRPEPPAAEDERASAKVPVRSYGGLLDPVPPGGGGSRISPLPMPAPAYPLIPPTQVPVIPTAGGPRGLVLAVAAARRADPRFRGLDVLMAGGVATISGRADRAADAWDLADAVAAVPGVERVVVGDVR